MKKILLMAFIGIALSGCTKLNAQILNTKAIAYMNNGEIDKAIGRLESSVDIAPDFPETYYNLGVAYHAKGDYKNAIKNLNRALELKNDMKNAFWTLAVVYEDISINIYNKNLEQETKIEESDSISYKSSVKLAIKNYEEYIKLSASKKDKDDAFLKIEYLNDQLSKYDT